MGTSSKIRVGIVGANPSRGFASIAHIPALQALPEFEITAVCTTWIQQRRRPGISGFRWRFPMPKSSRDIRMSIWSQSA